MLGLSVLGSAQNLSTLRIKSIYPESTEFKIDTLSIVPNSELIFSNNSLVPKTHYFIDYINSTLILKDIDTNFRNQIRISYRVFPINFTKKNFSRSLKETYISGPVLAQPKNQTNKNSTNFFNDKQLNKRGSISRGIAIGNNQDAVINSNLNLQISGRISENMSILAAISDENIPIQAEGNSQQIQDFDKVFIQLYNDKNKLIAGDFEIYKPTGYFMNVNKKGQGALLNVKTSLSKNKSSKFETTISGAISKGKYCRKSFVGQEGNQGPYKLTGCNNEQFIIILSGSEKVYINGRQLKRGKEYDYIINYNTGEISFTANKPITKESRIAIEFEYSERSYSRFFIFSSNTIKTQKGTFWLNIFSEQDSKNQSINQDLTSEHKKLLSEIGDNINEAIVPNIDSIEFRSDYVLYAKKDTSVNGISYAIYEYSTNPLQAHYQLGFSLVGNNKGNYIQIQNAANGRVFEWVAPINNIPQGNYEPIRLLVAPKKQQMLSFGGNLNLTKRTQTNFEIAISNNDINTFSDKDASDNSGYAISFDTNKEWIRSDTTENSFRTGVEYHIINKNFEAIERFRSVEFERDWNIQTPFISDEHFAELNLNYKHKNQIISNYDLSYLSNNADYTGFKNTLNTLINKSDYEFNLQSSILNTESALQNTQFLRYLLSIGKSFKYFKLGITNEFEQNTIRDAIKDSLESISFKFNSYKILFENPDSSINNYHVSYTLRNDYLPSLNSLKNSTQAEDFNLGFSLNKNPSNILKANVTYRKLIVNDTSLIDENAENTLIGRLSYSFMLFKGSISSNTFFEAGSGLEPKKEFSYLKVTDGQGVYAWTDYNNNGTAELDEFEIAQFQDQANYIRIYTPGNEYVKTNRNEFSQTLNINPYNLWKSKKGIRKILSKFSNSFAYLTNQKSTNTGFNSYNPFYKSTDSLIINLDQNIRNTLSFNKFNTFFGVDYIYQNNRNKILLTNGIDERKRNLQSINIRIKIFKDFTLQNQSDYGTKEYISQFFIAKNYTIENLKNTSSIAYQPGFNTRINAHYMYSIKENKLSVEISKTQKVGLELNYSISRKGNILAQINYLNIDYNSDNNSSIAYEMLEGLNPGNNGTWTLRFQRKLTKSLELNVNYNGRISENSSAIHAGSLQLRAFF